jgi:hypothetical protein
VHHRGRGSADVEPRHRVLRGFVAGAVKQVMGSPRFAGSNFFQYEFGPGAHY